MKSNKVVVVCSKVDANTATSLLKKFLQVNAADVLYPTSLEELKNTLKLDLLVIVLYGNGDEPHLRNYAEEITSVAKCRVVFIFKNRKFKPNIPHVRTILRDVYVRGQDGAIYIFDMMKAMLVD